MADNILRQVIKHGQLTEVPNEEVEIEFPSVLKNTNRFMSDCEYFSDLFFYKTSYSCHIIPLLVIILSIY